MGMPTATVQMKGPDGISRIGVGVGTGAGAALIRPPCCPIMALACGSAVARGLALARGYCVHASGCLRQLNQSAPCSLPSPRCVAGPVDAAYKAVDSLVRVEAQLTDYSVNSVTEGIEALATTRVIIRAAGNVRDAGFSDHAALGTVQRSFSGAAVRGQRRQALNHRMIAPRTQFDTTCTHRACILLLAGLDAAVAARVACLDARITRALPTALGLQKLGPTLPTSRHSLPLTRGVQHLQLSPSLACYLAQQAPLLPSFQAPVIPRACPPPRPCRHGRARRHRGVQRARVHQRAEQDDWLAERGRQGRAAHRQARRHGRRVNRGAGGGLIARVCTHAVASLVRPLAVVRRSMESASKGAAGKGRW